MKASLPLLCLLVAAVSAQHGAPARVTPHMVRRTVKLLPRLVGFGDSNGNSNNLGRNNLTDTFSTDIPTSTFSSTYSTASVPSSTYTPSTTTTYVPPTTTSTSSSSTRTRLSTTSYSSSVTTAAPTTSSSMQGSTVFKTETLAPSTSTSIAAASATQSVDTSSGSGSHMGLIIGVSVVGGVALLGALVFLWMKFGGRRFSDYQDEDADIKWPELKTDGDSAAMQPLPARRTGGAGFDMGNEFDEQPDADGQSMAEYGNVGSQSVNGSTTALTAGVGSAAAYGAGNGTYQSGMEGAYHDESPGSTNHYAQPVVAGYYDPYSSSAYPNSQPQTFYPEQGAYSEQGAYPEQSAGHDGTDSVPNPHQSAPQYEDYSNYSADPYAAARGQSTSPQMAPYRVNSQNMHRGY